MTQPVQAQPLNVDYEPPRPTGSARVWAAVGITLAGVILVGFGGCFLIGVMIQLNPQMVFGPANSTPWPPQAWVFHAVLYLMAFGCFAGGAWLTFRGTAALSRVIGEKP